MNQAFLENKAFAVITGMNAELLIKYNFLLL